MGDSADFESTTAVTEYEPIGREAAARRPLCGSAHDGVVWSSLLNSRPWPGTGLVIAECPHCMSTIAKEES